MSNLVQFQIPDLEFDWDCCDDPIAPDCDLYHYENAVFEVEVDESKTEEENAKLIPNQIFDQLDLDFPVKKFFFAFV